MTGMENMRGTIGLAALLIALSAGTAVSEEAGGGTDPFYPSAERPLQAAPSPRGADWGRDPFNNPLSERTTAQPQAETSRGRSTTLTGIIYGDQARVAIIGGETVREGERVGEQRVAEIRRRSVVLVNAEGGREEVFLRDFSIRK